MGPFRLISLLLMAAFYVLAGVMHFAAPGFYVQIMPASLPCPLFLVYLSGMCEIGLGLLLLVPRLRIWAAWGVILLLLAVFPANVNMAVHHLIPQGMPPWVPRPSTMALWLRLPMQLVLIAWAFLHTRPVRQTGALKNARRSGKERQGSPV